MRGFTVYSLDNRILPIVTIAGLLLGGVPSGLVAGVDSEMVAEMVEARREGVVVQYLTIE